jgi:predicted tellurium resistance membrane protein TerC
MPVHQRDLLAEFSHRLTQIKFIILEIVIFIGFLLWLYDKVKHDFNINFSPTSAHAAETHDPCHVTLPVFRSD